MSQDFQLAYRSPATQIEPWAAGNTALASPMAPPVNPLHRIHRSMRGRYALATVLALMGAAAGAAGGYLTGEPGYVSKGAIQVRPTMISLDKADTVMAMYERHMSSQAGILMSERLIKLAVKHPDWQAANPNLPADPISAFTPGLKAEFLKGTEFVQVTYTHPDPVVAQAGVKAVIKSYSQSLAPTEGNNLLVKLDSWQKKRAEANRFTNDANRTIEELGRKYGTQDLTILADTGWREVATLQSELQKAKGELAVVDAPNGPTSEDMAVEDISLIDPRMGTLVALREKIDLEMKTAKIGGALENQPRMRVLAQQLKIQDDLISERAEWFRAKYKGGRFNGGTGSGEGYVLKNVDDMKATIARLETMVEEQKKNAAAVSNVKQQIEQARRSIDEQRLVEKEAADQIERLTFQLDNLNRTEVISEGDLPKDPIDNRTRLALVGFVGGGAIPLGLLMMIGLLDTRYRYSDEAASTEMAGITLLGILPNLPDRLSDPEQAAIAAHCVHQIRTMLQINGGGLGVDGERRVFAVTSASPGDGKTSLTLALGLSYAACGTRTLLIDCDLVGAGLSTRMGVQSSEGVLEAIANRSLLDYIRTTDIADVAILPVGSAHGYHASTLSPIALRRLIDEAKKHFDTILVDTGPVLGSIEASLVCAAADGVVLAVSRGQSRPLVEKSLSHLNAIGARVAGVVFNRAQSNDFERSISGMSMRSVAAAGGRSGGNGNPPSASGAAVGPVARAVAPHARRTDGTDGMHAG